MKLSLDLHTHLLEGLGFPVVEIPVVRRICSEIKDRGLDGIAITEHNGLSLAFQVQQLVDREGMGILIIPGQEIEIGRFHVVELYFWGRRLRILAHPAEVPPDGVSIDAVEIASVKGKFDSPVVMDYVMKEGLPTLCNSDAHYLHELGCHRNCIDPVEFFNTGLRKGGSYRDKEV